MLKIRIFLYKKSFLKIKIFSNYKSLKLIIFFHSISIQTTKISYQTHKTNRAKSKHTTNITHSKPKKPPPKQKRTHPCHRKQQPHWSARYNWTPPCREPPRQQTAQHWSSHCQASAPEDSCRRRPGRSRASSLARPRPPNGPLRRWSPPNGGWRLRRSRRVRSGGSPRPEYRPAPPCWPSDHTLVLVLDIWCFGKVMWACWRTPSVVGWAHFSEIIGRKKIGSRRSIFL